jgi:hypothetical protein
MERFGKFEDRAFRVWKTLTPFPGSNGIKMFSHILRQLLLTDLATFAKGFQKIPKGQTLHVSLLSFYIFDIYMQPKYAKYSHIIYHFG